MTVQFLISLALKVLTNAALDRFVVLLLWERARKTPGVIDDAMVQGVAAALNVQIPGNDAMG